MGQPGQRCVAIFLFHPFMNTRINNADLATASRVSDTPLGQATVRINQNPGSANRKYRPRCEIRLGSLNVGSLGGKSLEVVEMMRRRKLEILCLQETKWKGDRARVLQGGYKLFHAGGMEGVMGLVF